MITVLTPSYNRGYILKNAYNSLVSQTDNDFEWIIVDDGSTDDTKNVVDSFLLEKKIKLSYYKKSNGGKHTAINYGVKKANGDFILILDSDDYLTKDAVKTIKHYIKKYSNRKKIACLSFLRIYEDGSTIGKEYSESEIISNYIDFKHNRGFTGDMAEVYKTEVLKKYPFPVFDEEKFLSEAIVWNKIALDYDTVFINKGIYVCEYLDDGLSKNILINRIKSPIGAYENAKMFMHPKFKLLIRLKNSIIYTGFYKLSFKKKILKDTPYKFLIILMYPAGLLFNLYLKSFFRKYGKK